MTDLSMALGVGCCGSDCDCCDACPAVAENFGSKTIGALGPTLDTGEAWVLSTDTAGIIKDGGSGTKVMQPGGSSLFPSLGAPMPECCEAGGPLRFTAPLAQTSIVGIGTSPIPFGIASAGWVFSSSPTEVTMIGWDLITVYGSFAYPWAVGERPTLSVNWDGTQIEVYLDGVLMGTFTVDFVPTAGLFGWVMTSGSELDSIRLECGDPIG